MHKEPLIRPGGKPYCWSRPAIERKNRPRRRSMYFTRFQALRLLDPGDPA